MRWISTTLAITTIAALAIALYLSIALPLLRDPPALAAPAVPAPASHITRRTPAADSIDAPLHADMPVDQPSPVTGTGPRQLEIHGRVSDADDQPIEGVLVTEERVFATTRSDAMGHYRLPLELPRQRLPIVNFLRAGYRGERVHLTWAQLGAASAHSLDVSLAGDADTLRLDGRVRNDSGVPLAGTRITIKSADTNVNSPFYLTVHSDAQGQFSLDGVPAERRYQLNATLSPGYPAYRDPDFYLGRESRPIDIELTSLRFVNLSGMILAHDGTPVPNLEFQIKNLSTGLHQRKLRSDSSGFFTLDGFPLGEVDLTTRGAEFFRIRGMHIDEVNHASLSLRVDRGDRYLDGWVSDLNGQPIEKAMVTLEARLETDGVEYFSYRSQTTDSSGRFAFAGLARRDYRISAYASGYATLRQSQPVDRQHDTLRLRLAPAD